MAPTEEGTPNAGGGGTSGDPGIGLGTPPKEPNAGLAGPPGGEGAPKGGEGGDAGKAAVDAAAAAAAEAAKAAAAKGAPKPKVPTMADGALAEGEPKPGDKTSQPAPATWPDDWRQQMAGDNKKALTRAERFKSPTDVLNSYLALEAKVLSGEYAKKLPTHYTEEELAEYRKANGIPDKPEEYNLDVPGLVWGEADKATLDSWRQFAFENHLPPEIAKLGPLWYAREQENIVDRLEQQDQDNFQVNTAALQAEWGKEFKPNINAVKNLFEDDVTVWEEIMGSRNSDGLRGGDNPKIMKKLAKISRELNPNATLVPNIPAADQGKTIDLRINELNGMMRDRSGPYWKGPQSVTLQEEYRTLVDRKAAFEARNSRAA